MEPQSLGLNPKDTATLLKAFYQFTHEHTSFHILSQCQDAVFIKHKK